MASKESPKGVGDPLAQLERAFIEEFLGRRGYQLSALADLPEEQSQALLKEASVYASGRLTEVETRAHLVDDLHSATPSVPGHPPKRQG